MFLNSAPAAFEPIGAGVVGVGVEGRVEVDEIDGLAVNPS